MIRRSLFYEEFKPIIGFTQRFGRDIKGGKPQLFLDEHFKLKEFVKLLKKEITKLPEEPNLDSKLIWLLDRESFFKRLCSHHDKRETEILYPELDRITTEAEKTELLSRVTCAFSSSKAV